MKISLDEKKKSKVSYLSPVNFDPAANPNIYVSKKCLALKSYTLSDKYAKMT
jgi:hypothetical protein